MMFDMLPIEQLTAIRPVRLDIHFMHECRYGQTLTVGYEQRDGLSLFEVSNGEEAAVRAALEPNRIDFVSVRFYDRLCSFLERVLPI